MPELPWIFTRLSGRALVDILSVTLIIHWLLWFAQRTRAAQLIRGLTILIVGVLLAASIFNLSALGWLITRAWPVFIVSIPIIFQPEIRRALEQLGHTGQWLRQGLTPQPDANVESAIEEVSRAMSQLSRVGYGALLVIERETGLQDYAGRGVQLDALVTRQLLINIFYPNSPLHDGAVIVRNNRIIAANCILPLSEREATAGKIGTRHQAAIGITEESDAIAVVVSEETNRISIAHNGRLTENLDQERLRRALRSLLRVDRDPRAGSAEAGLRANLSAFIARRIPSTARGTRAARPARSVERPARSAAGAGAGAGAGTTTSSASPATPASTSTASSASTATAAGSSTSASSSNRTSPAMQRDTTTSRD